MGVLLLNIETTPYKQLLGNLKATSLDAKPCCDLDARVSTILLLYIPLLDLFSNIDLSFVNLLLGYSELKQY
jgi:hypothetical protein